jgi:hypothetical protein
VRLACLIGACAATITTVDVAQATRALDVSVSDCPGWSSSELERLIRLELATVGGGESDVGSADVSISCHGGEVELVATDSRSRRSLSRVIGLESEAEGADRVLSISVAQLVRALDWLPETRPTRPEPRRPPVAERPSPPVLTSKPFELHLGAGSRVRELPSSLLTYRLGLGSGFELAHRFRLGGGVSFERGDTLRRGGQVEAQLLGAAVQSSLEPLAAGSWSCLLRFDLSLQHLTLRGTDAEPGVVTSRVRGFGGEAQASLGPALRWKDIGVALLAQMGGAYFGGEALVTRDRPVSLDGAWAGAELALLWTP